VVDRINDIVCLTKRRTLVCAGACLALALAKPVQIKPNACRFYHMLPCMGITPHLNPGRKLRASTYTRHRFLAVPLAFWIG
jgi:hypothetical protein